MIQPKIKTSWEGGLHIQNSISGNRPKTYTVMYDIGVGKVSVSVMTTTSPDNRLTTAMHGINQTLHNTLWIVCCSCCSADEVAEVSGVVDSSRPPDPVHPTDVVFGSSPADRGNVRTLWRCRNSRLTRATRGLTLPC